MNIYRPFSIFGLLCSMLLLGCSTPPGYYGNDMAFNSVEPYWVYEKEVYLMPPYHPYPSDYYPRHQVADDSSSWSVERRRNARPMPMPTAPITDPPPPIRHQQQETSTSYFSSNSSAPAQRQTVDIAPKIERIEPLKPAYPQ